MSVGSHVWMVQTEYGMPDLFESKESALNEMLNVVNEVVLDDTNPRPLKTLEDIEQTGENSFRLSASCTWVKATLQSVQK